MKERIGAPRPGEPEDALWALIHGLRQGCADNKAAKRGKRQRASNPSSLSIGMPRPWEPEEALMLCYAGARMGDDEFRANSKWWEPVLDQDGLPPAFPPPIRAGRGHHRRREAA